MHPFRFSLQGFDASSASGWRETVRRAEDLGYGTFHLADHYLGPGPALAAANHPPQPIAAMPAIAMALEATRTLRVGCRVFCASYRPAPVLVKEAMTLDFLSDGRLELGLGAGWIRSEYEAMGIPWESAGRRIDRLEETVALLEAHQAGGELDIRGEHVRAVGYQGLPRPVQDRVPLMIGGGAPRILRFAGRKADIVSVNFDNRTGAIGRDSFLSSTAERTREKIGWIREGAGERFGELEIETSAMIVAITDRRAKALADLAAQLELPEATVAELPHILVGSVDHVCETLEARRETYGFSYISVMNDNAEPFAPVVARLTGR